MSRADTWGFGTTSLSLGREVEGCCNSEASPTDTGKDDAILTILLWFPGYVIGGFREFSPDSAEDDATT
jgi:hypothetical protein